MALSDYETFIQERLTAYDETIDVSSGSPIDTQVIQPLLRRLGTDPFTVDASTFIVTRLSQAFPDLAASDGDAVTDLLTKPALLLWDPIIREIQRVKNMLSLRDPTILTIDEADALGANIFATRDQGDYARGIGRIYFAQPQSISISPSNFFTDVNGQHFFPTSVQSIKASEMLLNLEGSLYYFDVNVIAESTGDSYNIGPTQLSTIANVAAAVRVTNKARFQFGIPAEDAVTFIGRVDQELTERSLVTERGIVARLSDSFPDVTSVAVIGFNDPEMQRDVLTGGGLGPMVAFGGDASSYPDGEFQASTRRVTMPSADFFDVIGPVGPVQGWVLTLFNAFQGAPQVRDLVVSKVIDQHTLEIVDQVIKPTTFNVGWCLREITLSLSSIPGGILYPDSATGTVETPPDQVHIGGCTDILLRTTEFDTGTLVIDVLEDNEPILAGTQAYLQAVPGAVQLLDYILTPQTNPPSPVPGVNYSVDDDTYSTLQDAGKYRYQLRILTGPAAGVYEVYRVEQVPNLSPFLYVNPVPVQPPDTFSWELISAINMDLVNPVQTRYSGSTGTTIQNVNVFSTTDGVNFAAYGTSPGDTLEILDGQDAGTFTVESINPPFYTQLILDRPFTTSAGGIKYSVYRPNKAGGVQRPLMRITEIDLLDSTSQPVGTTIPYAQPVDIRSNSYQNTGGGIKVSVDDAILGLVSMPVSAGGTFPAISTAPGDNTLRLSWNDTIYGIAVNLGGPPMKAVQIAAAINAVSQATYGYAIAVALQYGNQDYVGILPVGTNVTTTASDTSPMEALFGPGVGVRTSNDIKSATVSALPGGWGGIRPVIDQNLDVANVIDGLQAGFYGDLAYDVGEDVLTVGHDFAPEISRSVDVGSRSVGSSRLYFLAPTSIEIDQGTVFSTTDANGNILNFFPDPTLGTQKLPALPNGTIPQDGITSWDPIEHNNIFQSPSSDFDLSDILPGDQLIISYVPVTGSVMLPDPVPSLALLQLRLSVENQIDQFVIFINDVSTPNAVSRQGVADQINGTVGFNVCSIVQSTAGEYYLQFGPTVSIIIRQQNGSGAQANTALGFSNTADTNNDSPNKGTYIISEVGFGGSDVLFVGDPSITPLFPVSIPDQQFSIYRVGTQRISSTQMASNLETDGTGFYYWDVDLVSQGTGDLWNIGAGDAMTAQGYRSDGFYLTTTDATTTFSTAESIQIHFSPTILEVGVDDDPSNATQLSGQSVSIQYEYSSIVENVQSFVSAETERVINESALVRSLVPHYMRFTLDYNGGSLPSVIQPILESYITALLPTQAADTGSIQKIVTNNGATFVQNPIEVVAVVYNFDRSVLVARSQGSISTTRLAMFIPDVITLNQTLTSG